MSTDCQMKKWNKPEVYNLCVGDAKCEKGISDNLLRMLWTNKEQFPIYKDLK